MLTFLIVILLLVLIFGLSIFMGLFNFVLNILRTIFLFGRHPRNPQQGRTKNSTKKKSEKVLFDKNEAEDADYEEIK